MEHRSSKSIKLENPRKINTFLPDEIIQEILQRLPAKSLLRFSSVSKQFFNLISDPKFVQTHLKYVLSDHNLHQKLMILSPKSSKVCSIDYVSPDDNAVIITSNLPKSKICTSNYVLGSCNGLVCLRYFGELTIIWNPLLNKYKEVKYYHMLRIVDRVGFGYDPLTDDYKLVTIDVVDNKVMVYTLRNNSSRIFPLKLDALTNSLDSLTYPWDALTKTIPTWFDVGVGMYFNASLYWIINETFEPVKLVCFDLKYEKFKDVEIPGLHLHRGEHLVVTKGCLCVISMDYENNHLHLLMMEEDENNVISWRNGAKIQLPNGLINLLIQVISITIKGEILMKVENDDSLQDIVRSLEEQKELSSENCKNILYNPYQGSIKIIPVYEFQDWCESTTYEETLVSP